MIDMRETEKRDRGKDIVETRGKDRERYRRGNRERGRAVG
jgi:hypothetical protein